MTDIDEMLINATDIYQQWYRLAYWAKCPRCDEEAQKDESISNVTFLAGSVNCPECQGTRLDSLPWTELFHGEHYEARR